MPGAQATELSLHISRAHVTSASFRLSGTDKSHYSGTYGTLGL